MEQNHDGNADHSDNDSGSRPSQHPEPLKKKRWGLLSRERDGNLTIYVIRESVSFHKLDIFKSYAAAMDYAKAHGIELRKGS